MAYGKWLVTARGGPEHMVWTKCDAGPLQPGMARMRVLAVAVCADDISVRRGNRPVLPKLPFTPGYSFIGAVEAVGDGVVDIKAGDRVAALTNFGAYAERIDWRADELVAVPDDVDPAEAAPLILDWLVAYQCLHREARLERGDTALVIGASGGVGRAFLALGQLGGVKMYGLCSGAKSGLVASFGAVPIDYQRQAFVSELRRMEPQGVDAVFNGMAGGYLGRGLKVLKPGGVLVHYGAPESMVALLLLIPRLLWRMVLPVRRKVRGYGTHRLGFDRMKDDWLHLFNLLRQGEIRPVIAERLPIAEAKRANELFELGTTVGHIILVADD